jgi:FtsZ-binding cell division protein ZapB
VQTTIEDRIAEVLNQTMNTIRETEASIKIEIESFKEQLQRVEFELVGKQDTIEALELACSEHVQNCREMQEEIEKLKLGLMNV